MDFLYSLFQKMLWRVGKWRILDVNMKPWKVHDYTLYIIDLGQI